MDYNKNYCIELVFMILIFKIFSLIDMLDNFKIIICSDCSVCKYFFQFIFAAIYKL